METVGRFSWDGQSVIGPKGYMEDPQGFAKVKASLENGTNPLIGAAPPLIGAAPIGTDTVTLMLVAIQTDFAGWWGHQEMLGWLRR